MESNTTFDHGMGYEPVQYLRFVILTPVKYILTDLIYTYRYIAK